MIYQTASLFACCASCIVPVVIPLSGNTVEYVLHASHETDLHFPGSHHYSSRFDELPSFAP